MVAPASANVIAKLSHGLADDMLTTTVLACRCKKIVSPAMNTGMYENPITQDNLAVLRRYGFLLVEPAVGYLACGDTGAGKMPEPEVLLDYILQELAYEKDMAGLRFLVTAGATQESIDPVRYITNHSTGKMGYAVAQDAARRGAEVTLVSAPSHLPPLRFVKNIPVVSAQEMFDAVTALAGGQDVIVKAAAVADYRPAQVLEEKMKKSEFSGSLSLSLTRTQDILQYLGEHRRPGQFLCGFSMETENVLENSRRKLRKKHLDLIAANSLRIEGAGFGTDTNVLTLISAHGERELPKMSKQEAAHTLLTEIMQMRQSET